MTPLDRFVALTRDITTTESIEQLLDWDQEVLMPPRAADHRAQQIAFLSGLAHERLTSDDYAAALRDAEQHLGAAAAGSADATAWVGPTNVREMRRKHDRARRIPTSLVKEIAATGARGRYAWRAARSDNAFDRFAPVLERLLELKREVAERIGYTTEPYDALLDEFEPGARSAEVGAVFVGLKGALQKLIAAISASPRRPDLSLLARPCPVAAQMAFSRRVAEALGFDFSGGRLDVSTHPFCGGTHSRDVRMTTRYDEHHLAGSLFGTLHETGHALYEQGFAYEHTGTPAASAVSLGIHESQSRMWENIVGRSRPFWEHFLVPLHEAFPALAGVAIDDWLLAVNAVRPSLIRVEADEVTYGLHIMLRFELERSLLSGKLAVRDLPDAWNAGMQSLLGITPPTDREGCLQDIHWSSGTFGYFPTYALGNLYAAQFYAAARAALPELDAHVRRGEFAPLREWLRSSIHQHGMRYRANELVRVVTGAPLSADPFVAYLNAKFGALYALG